MKNPIYSLVIVNHDGRTLTERCLASILPHIDPATTEIVLVENGSTLDDSLEWMRTFARGRHNVRLLTIRTHTGLMKARGAGFKAAKGDYVLSLDNDVVWHGDVLSVLRSVLDSQPAAGIAGMCGAYIPDLHHYVHIYHDASREPLEVTATTGYCMMIKRAVLDAGVHVDQGLKVYQGEDYDICFQARAAGFKVFMVPGVPLVHEEHGSMKPHKARLLEFMLLNYAYIERKWAKHAHILSDGVTEEIFSLLSRDNALVATLTVGPYRFFDYLPKTEVLKRSVYDEISEQAVRAKG